MRRPGTMPLVGKASILGGVAALAGLLLVLAVPVTQASAITNSGSRAQAVAKSLGSANSYSLIGGNPATVGVANAVLAGAGASSIPMTVSVSNPVPLPASSGAEYGVTITVGMGKRTGTLMSRTQFSGSGCGYDGSYSVYQCTTMYYNIKSDSSNLYFADNHQDSIQATNDDPTSAVLSSLTLRTGGTGFACNGSGSLSGGQTWNIGSPTSGTVYTETPSWSGNYYSLTNVVDGTNQDVVGTLHWYYRGNAETLVMSYILPNSMPSWPTGGCAN